MIEGRRFRLTVFTWALFLIGFSTHALAVEPPLANTAGGGPANPVPSALSVSATPIFGEGTLRSGGWGELLIQIRNDGRSLARGIVIVSNASYDTPSLTETSYAVTAGAVISLRVPVAVDHHRWPEVVVRNEAGQRISEIQLNQSAGAKSFLADTRGISALKAALDKKAVPSRYDAWHAGRWARSSAGPMTQAEVVAPPIDSLSGEPILPHRSVGYARLSAVLMGSDQLCSLPATELLALSNYLLAGGTLALVVSRPEDLRNERLTALLGSTISATEVNDKTLAPLIVASGPPSTPNAEPELEGELKSLLTGYKGGNLQASPYGSSAPYGLGEVHLLAFDPAEKPAVDSPWSQTRIIDLLRRADERLSTILLRPGDIRAQQPQAMIRRQLDPNESARWAIVLTTLLLLLYAVVAGPVNFGHFRRRSRPLKALAALPLYSLGAFALVVFVGVSSKGCSGRSRHLTIVDAGAGMKVATARRWRGFFRPTARQITVPASHNHAVIARDVADSNEQQSSRIVADRSGLRLVDVQLQPWQTAVIREDDNIALGDGISLHDDGAGNIIVTNRSGRDLRGLMLAHPGSSDISFLPALENGDRASSKSFTAMPTSISRHGSSGLVVNTINFNAIEEQLEQASTGLSDAWQAIYAYPAYHHINDTNWLPGGVPALFAQLDGGEGKTHDSGMRIDRDRLLIRVVGFGGAP